MKKQNRVIHRLLLAIGFFSICYIAMCEKTEKNTLHKDGSVDDQDTNTMLTTTTSLTQLEDGLFTIRYDEDYGFEEFLSQGGASFDEEVVDFLMANVLDDISGLEMIKGIFGCSTMQTRNEQGDVLFGRNFDWEKSEALIIESNADNAYASISTVNLDFIQSGTSLPIDRLPDDILAKIAMYTPLDGMNEKGFVISVNMIQDGDVINQSHTSQNLTTTTAIRLLLNQAENVDEAIALLEQYNLHSSMGMMVHFAMADATGKSVVVEYIDNEMKVVETPVVTNFYLAEGSKKGIGTAQSKQRYDILMALLKEKDTMAMQEVKDALDRVSKDNFDEFESTEWSIVYNLQEQEIHYYHRENYNQRYVFQLEHD